MKALTKTAVLLCILAAPGGFLACSKEPDYGTLQCMDGWPELPDPTPLPSLAMTPRVLWQTGLGALAALPDTPTVVLHGDRLYVSAGANIVALDRTTGTVLSTETLGAPNLFLGPPTLDSNGGVYVASQSTLYSFSADRISGWQWQLPGFTPTTEPSPGLIRVPLVADRMVLTGGWDGKARALDTTTGHEIWSSATGAGLRSVGHWGYGVGSNGAFMVDLRTGRPAGKLRDAAGRDTSPLVLLAGRGILGLKYEKDLNRLTLLDTCGKEKWSLELKEPGIEIDSRWVLVGQGETIYLQTGVWDSAGRETRPRQLVAVSPDGHIVAGPVSTDATPWIAGGDGTLYATGTRPSNPLQSAIVAYSPALAELWSLDLPGGPSYAGAISDDGIAYFQTRTSGGNTVIAIQTTSPGLSKSSWPSYSHDNRGSNWGGGTF